MDGKFCVECGKRLPMSAAFCDRCGTRQPKVDFPSAENRAENTADTAFAENTAEVDSFADNADPESSPAQNSQEYSGYQQQSAPQYIPPAEEVEEVNVYDDNGGLKTGYIALLGLALVVTAGIVWALFAINEGVVNDSSSEVSYSIEKPSEVETSKAPDKSNPSKKPDDGGYSGVGGQNDKRGDFWEEGGYIVGRDIPEGTYLVYPDYEAFENHDSEDEYVRERAFYMQVTEDNKDVVGGWCNGSVYVELKKGQHIKTIDANIYDAETADVDNDPFKYAGAFIVGKDVKAGTYTFKLLTDQGYENYAVFDGVDDYMENDAFARYEYFDEGDIVTLEDGQLLIMGWCCLDKKVAAPEPAETTTTAETAETTTTTTAAAVIGTVTTTASDTYKGVMS